MPRGSSPKRERQYEHIKESAQERGESAERAKEIAARTVNKERARAGESKTASKTSLEDMSSSERGGRRLPHRRAGAHVRPALRGGQAQEPARTLVHEQGRTQGEAGQVNPGRVPVADRPHRARDTGRTGGNL